MGRLTAAHRAALRFILQHGPGTFPLLKSGRHPKAVHDLVQRGFLETLNRIRPGPAVYEITSAGRAALENPTQ